MRNWNSKEQINTKKECLVLSLPMRNWNRRWPTARSRTATCSQPTYEELKPHPGGSIFRHPISSQPTYEELKQPASASQRASTAGSQPTYEELKQQIGPAVKRYPKFSAYLWGIETLIDNVLCMPILSSQPTYEELKLLKSFFLKKKLYCSQPTYEELKRKFCCCLRLPQQCSQPTYEELKRPESSRPWSGKPGSQPTYEELKHRNIYIPVRWHHVLSLPMRNWNRKSWSRSSSENGFSAYLWGIETLDHNNFDVSDIVLSLPMRNWNSQVITTP